jgi:hypothetical protein
MTLEMKKSSKEVEEYPLTLFSMMSTYRYYVLRDG